jgi:hypothetical protein
MFMNANISLHPAIDCYYKKFLEKPTEPSGVLVGNMDDLKIGESVQMEGGYFVCARKIHLNLAKDIYISGPCGGLLAAPKVQLAAPTIILTGDQQHPVTIVALDCLDLESRNFHLNHVTLVLMRNTYVKIDLSIRRFEHLKVIEIDAQGKEIRQFAFAYEGFMRYVLEKKAQTQNAVDFNEMQRSIVDKMGLKPLLLSQADLAHADFFHPETKIPKGLIKLFAAAEIDPILRKIDQKYS